MQKLSALALAALSLLCLASCNNGCEQTREAYCVLQVVPNSESHLAGVTVSTLVPADTLNAKGETVWNEHQFAALSTTGQFEVILNPNDTVTTLNLDIRYKSYDETFQAKDTVRVYYTVQPHYLDIECGCTLHFDLQRVETTHHLLQSVRITQPLVTNESALNIEANF